MKLVPTSIGGCYQIELRRLADERGHFVTVFDLEAVRTVDPGFSVTRINRSLTRRPGAIRGLHFQREPMAEDKVVQCLRGSVYDVCVDLRPDSETYLRWVGLELSAESERMLLVPRGCAHGFQALEEDTLVEYFVSGLYSPPHEGGMRWDDPALAIAWPLPCTLTSERDAAWPLLSR